MSAIVTGLAYLGAVVIGLLVLAPVIGLKWMASKAGDA